jgi:hypothetical protein
MSKYQIEQKDINCSRMNRALAKSSLIRCSKEAGCLKRLLNASVMNEDNDIHERRGSSLTCINKSMEYLTRKNESQTNSKVTNKNEV